MKTVTPPSSHTLAEAVLLAEGLILVGAVHHHSFCLYSKTKCTQIPPKGKPRPESMRIQLPCGSKVLFGHYRGVGARNTHSTPRGEKIS